VRFHQILFQVRKTATGYYEMLKTAFGEQAMGRSKTFFSSFPGLRLAELRLMMTNALVDQCPVQRQK